MYAEIAVNAPVAGTFDYHVPPDLEGQIAVGHLVTVPFGTAKQHGIVLRLHQTPPDVATKPILTRLDAQPTLTDTQIALSRWLAETTLAPIGMCLWLWLPPNLTGMRDVVVRLADEPDDSLIKTDIERELVAVLERRGALRGAQLNQALAGKDWRGAVDTLARSGVVEKESMLTPPRAKPKMIQTAVLAIPPDQIEAAALTLERPSKPADLLEALAAQVEGRADLKALLRATGATQTHADKLIEDGWATLEEDDLVLAQPAEDVQPRLRKLRKLEKPLRIMRMLAREADAVEVSWVYAQTSATLTDLKRLAEAELIRLGEAEKFRDSLAGREFVAVTPPKLTPEQADAWETLRSTILAAGGGAKEQKPFLLHGVTGSGKTEIYLRAIELTLALGRSAIFLVPEIALTPQTVRRVAARFPGRVGIMHSRISDGERYDNWRRAREGLIQVAVGARSALFTPFENVGLIILDEEHDSSYKQTTPIPSYHARTLAEQIAKQHGGVLILGSATPDIETVYRAERGEIRLLVLPNRIVGHKDHIRELAERQGIQPRYTPAEADDALTISLPPVRIVDMRAELKRGNTSIFSRALQEALHETLARKEQAILFLNRRGQATYVFCRDCGYVASCPRCSTPLTYHREGDLRCHRCDFSMPEPTICPNCRSKRIKFFGAGTQQVESALYDLFPKAKVVRWDADSASSHQSHEAILDQFVNRKADIMVGTQMVAKGLDLPLVTLVGVVSADTGLAMPDFRAAERTFQLLTQVAGRAGRGLLGGEVILQTYQPGHYAIQAAAQHDYAGFYQRELAYRRDLGYPPFRRMIRFVFRFPTERQARAEAERAAQTLAHRLKALNMSGTEIIGPAPCFFTRENDEFRWHLLLRGPDPTAALAGMVIPKGWHVDVDPAEVL